MVFLAHQHVDAAVELAHFIERRDAVGQRPVHLVVGERLAVEAAEQAEDVRVVLDPAQVLAVRVEVALLLPEVRHARVVLPAVEALQVGVDVQGAQGEGQPQRLVAVTVDLAARLGRQRDGSGLDNGVHDGILRRARTWRRCMKECSAAARRRSARAVRR
ncbi:hypothetical protein D3C76_1217640 [compost metagenome]